jgi:hypothetical protein
MNGWNVLMQHRCYRLGITGTSLYFNGRWKEKIKFVSFWLPRHFFGSDLLIMDEPTNDLDLKLLLLG